MRQLDPIEQSQIKRLYADEDISCSGRPEDKARQRLKRLGLIAFHPRIKWHLTEAGRKLRELSNRTGAA